MPEDVLTPGPGDGAPGHVYPPQFARFVRERWAEVAGWSGGEVALPGAETLEHFLSTSYQASLLREEERPVTFRAILAAPELVPAEGRPPQSLQRVEFFRSLPFDATELRRLSVATDAQRTLIGVGPDEDGCLRIWGLVNSGTRWLRDVQGGRQAGVPLPPVPVVDVDAPGSIAAHKGNHLVARLRQGRVSGTRADPFASAWLPEQFAAFRGELMERHARAAARAGRAGEQWAPLHPELSRRISERMMKRVIAVLSAARHGGTIAFVPTDSAVDLSAADPHLDLKYRFNAGQARRSFPDLVVDILNRLAQMYGGDARRPEPVGWDEFETSMDGELAVLDEALFETAHVIARLAAADGAVVMTKQHEILGFGGMISGRLPAVRTVARALDLEGERVVEEHTGNVGARHRSAYRLANAMPGAVVVVISQDGGVRFVARKSGRVTYWEQE